MKTTILTIKVEGDPRSGKSTMCLELADMLGKLYDNIEHEPETHEIKVVKYWHYLPRQTI